MKQLENFINKIQTNAICDCWLFVFQYSFVTQRLKLRENVQQKNACIFLNVICAKDWKFFKIIFFEICKQQRFINFAAQFAGKEIANFK